MKSIRALYLTTDLERGGLPLRLVALVKRLATMGVHPIVGSLARRGPLHEDLESAGIETFDCGGRGGWDVRCLFGLAGVVRRFDPDLVHASLFHANVAARVCGRAGRLRPVITSSVTVEVERRWHRRIEALTCGLSDAHVANSQAVARHLIDVLGFPPGLVRVIRNGIDMKRIDDTDRIDRGEHGLRNEVPLIVWAGRMDPVKRLDVFVEVMARLRSRGEVQAVLLGDGPVRARVVELVRRCGLHDVIRIVGWSPNVSGWLKSADALLFPSLTEGCPNVVLEALACGCPVVASRIPPHEEIITDESMGWLCDGDDPNAFVAALVPLMERRSRSFDSVAARQFVSVRHGLDSAASQWRSLYNALLS